MKMNRIKDLRAERNMRQEELAALLSVRRQSISRYETGQNDLDTATIRRLCEIFDCTADYLLGLSSRREKLLSDEDATLLEAYHAAPPDTQAGIATILRPFMEERTLSALPGGQGDERHG